MHWSLQTPSSNNRREASTHGHHQMVNTEIRLITFFAAKVGEALLVQFSCSVVSDSLQPMDCSMPGLPVHHQLPEFTQTHVHWVHDAIHLILCRSLLPPSIFPSIRVFSNESVLHIRWPKYWSFSFNNSPSNEHSALIFFRMNWLDLLASSSVCHNSFSS